MAAYTCRVLSDAGPRVRSAYFPKMASVGVYDAQAAVIAKAVRAELATELARVDVAVSSRLATAGYTAPDNAGIAALPTLAEIEAALPTVPTAAENAAATLAAAQAAPIHANVKQQNSAPVIGSGIPTDKWRGVQP